MQFAQIVVDQSTRGIHDTFTYKIPPLILPNIKIGQAVIVPFRNKKIAGIIIRLVKKPPVGVEVSALKLIDRIVTEVPIVTEYLLRLVHWLSHHTCSTLGQAMFTALPAIPNKPLEHSHQIEPAHQHKISQKLILLGSLNERLDAYQKIIAKLPISHTAIILFPEVQTARSVKDHFFPSAELIDPTDTPKNRVNRWIDARSGRIKIVIGSLSTVFTPSPSLSVIIVDNPAHPAYRHLSTPNYQTLDVAIARSSIEQCHIVVGASSLPVVLAPSARSQTWRVKNLNKITSPTVLDYSMTNAQPLSEEVASLIDKSSTTCLLIPRKYLGKAYYCQDCQRPFICENCQAVVRITADTNLVCQKCFTKINQIKNCQFCHSPKLKLWQIGLPSIEAYSRKRFPDKQIFSIHAGAELPINFIAPENSIVVATNKIFAFTSLHFNLGVSLSVTDGLFNPSFTAEEIARLQMFSFMRMCDKTIFQVGVEWRDSINNLLSPGWVDREVATRQKYHLPPFSRIISINKKYSKIGKAQAEIGLIVQFCKRNMIEILSQQVNAVGNGEVAKVVITITPDFGLDRFGRLTVGWNIDPDAQI